MPSRNTTNSYRRARAHASIKTFLSALAITLALVVLSCATGCANGTFDSRNRTNTTEMEISDISYEPTEEELIYAEANKQVSTMNLHDKVSQMVVTRPEQISSDKTAFTAKGQENLDAYPFGGVCYFSDNLSTPTELRQALTDMSVFVDNGALNIGMFVSVDEEGGGVTYPNAVSGVGGQSGVSRIAKADFPGTTRLYPMFYYKDDGAQVAFDNAATIASYLEQYGFNWDFAPVADTNSNPDNPVIGYRAYSDDYQQCAKLVASAVEGYESENMACSLKHFPGHGDTATDSHKGATIIDDKDYYQLKSQELVPFQAGIDAGADSVMMGHITVTAVDDKPASMSREWVTNILRDMMGFDGVIMTDGLGMGALTNEWSNAEIAVNCTKAGCDVLLLPEDPYGAVDAVVAAVEAGNIPEEEIDAHVVRILQMKAKHGIWDWDSNEHPSE